MARTAVFFPLAVAVGLVPAILTGGEQLPSRWSGSRSCSSAPCGCAASAPTGSSTASWPGWASSSRPSCTPAWALVPELLLARWSRRRWVVLLSSFVFPSDPRRVLHSTLGACFARGRAVARECVDLLEARTGSERARQRALRTLAAPAGRAVRDRAARRGVVGRAAGAARGLVGDGAAPADDRDPAGGRALRRRGRGPAGRLRRAGRRGAPRRRPPGPPPGPRGGRREPSGSTSSRTRPARPDDEDWWPARHLAYGVREFLRFDAAGRATRPRSTRARRSSRRPPCWSSAACPAPPRSARDVATRGARWNPDRPALHDQPARPCR